MEYREGLGSATSSHTILNAAVLVSNYLYMHRALKALQQLVHHCTAIDGMIYCWVQEERQRRDFPTDHQMADPLSITLAAITLGTALKDLTELALKLHESFKKVHFVPM